MKNKILNSLLLVGNVLYTIGLVLTSVLIIKSNKSFQSESANLTLLFLPSIICTFFSIILFCLYFYNKRNYFLLVKMHINSKWIFFHYIGGLLLSLGILVTAILMWISNIISIDAQNTWYFYFVIALNILFLIISYGIDAYSKFRISVDIARRKMGEEFEQSHIFKNKNLLEDFNSIADDSFSHSAKPNDLDLIDFENQDVITRNEKPSN